MERTKSKPQARYTRRKSRVSIMGWSCSGCTYRNHNDSAKACFTCGTARPAGKETPSIDLTDSDEDCKISAETTTTKTEAKHPATKKRDGGSQRPLLGGWLADESKISKPSKKRAKTATTAAEPVPSSQKLAVQTTIITVQSSSATYKPLSNEPYAVKYARSLKILKETFNIDKLRNQQPKAIECALKRQSQIVVMATGGGKSKLPYGVHLEL